jgi:hypothetical protein
MGDGQHLWAAAEWVLLVRNLLVREEADHLVVGSGLDRRWLDAGPVALTETLTPWGPVSVQFTARESAVHVRLIGQWRGRAPRRLILVPGCARLDIPANDSRREFVLPISLP